MRFDSRDSGLADGPQRACIAGVIVSEVRLRVEPVPLRLLAQAAMSAFGPAVNAIRLSARRKTYRNETLGGHHLCIR